VEELGKKKKVEGLSVEELEAQRVELLPDREEMQPTISWNLWPGCHRLLCGSRSGGAGRIWSG
jgi:hypothetical protein